MSSKTLAKLFYPFTNIWEFLDAAAFFVSPLAVLGFIIFSIMALDEFGQHVRFLRGIDGHGLESVGTWNPVSSSGKYAYVAFDKEENGQTGVLVEAKYYSEETLSSLVKGQRVRVRYALPPEYEFKAVLVDEYQQVKDYAGYFTDLLWPFLFCWATVVIHPEWLYLGFKMDLSPPWEKKA